MEFPRGFKFSPSDEELVSYYLRRKIHGLPIPLFTVQDHHESFLDPRAIKWDHVSYIRDNERYYFLKRVQIATNGNTKKVKRIGSDENGFWKVAQTEKKIYDRHNQVIGFVSLLNYFTYKDSLKICKLAVKTRWIMHEYKLPTQQSFQEWVVCRIKDDARETTTQRQHKNQQRQEEESDTFDSFADFLETTLMSPNHYEAQQDYDHACFVAALERAQSQLPLNEQQQADRALLIPNLSITEGLIETPSTLLG